MLLKISPQIHDALIGCIKSLLIRKQKCLTNAFLLIRRQRNDVTLKVMMVR